MGKPTFSYYVREFIAHIAWRVFLWAHGMTEKQYDYAVHVGCEPVKPMKYWQHDETGRLCAVESRPSERWYEITEKQYEQAFARSFET